MTQVDVVLVGIDYDDYIVIVLVFGGHIGGGVDNIYLFIYYGYYYIACNLLII